MKKLINMCVFLPLFCGAQGIHFETGLTWQQIKEKARAENKYIFVDCYASWCGPCKKMDQDVYPKDSVGEVVNSRFVCVKVQMDTSKKDNDTIKAWYAVAHELMTSCKVTAFPTFLFFSPLGELVHRGVGYQRPSDFVQLAVDGVDPHKEYYVLVANYRAGARDFAEMPGLADRAKAFNERALADSIAADYLHGYLDKLDANEICTQVNIGFIAGFANDLSSKDKAFRCIYEHITLVDSIMHGELGERFINYIVNKEQIKPVTEAANREGKEPDWDAIGSSIQLHYGAAWVEKNLVNARIAWYKVQKDWDNYTKFIVKRMDIVGVKNTPHDFWSRFGVNVSAWEVFQYSKKRNELEKALKWINWVIDVGSIPIGPFIDTKANLLYKLGKRDEALALETKAMQADPKNKELATNFEKMQHGEPTWIVAL